MDNLAPLPQSGDRQIQNWSPGQNPTVDERVKRLTRTIVAGQKRLQAQIAERMGLLTRSERAAAEAAGAHYVQVFCTGAPLDSVELATAYGELIQAHVLLLHARASAAQSLARALIEAQR